MFTEWNTKTQHKFRHTMRMFATWITQHSHGEDKYRQYAQRQLDAHFYDNDEAIAAFINEYNTNILPYMDEITMANTDRFTSADMMGHRMLLNLRFEKVIRELSIGERNQLLNLLYEFYKIMSLEITDQEYFSEEKKEKYQRQHDFMLSAEATVATSRRRRQRARAHAKRPAAAANNMPDIGGLMSMFSGMMGGSGAAAGAGAGAGSGQPDMMSMMPIMMQMMGILNDPAKMHELMGRLETTHIGRFLREMTQSPELRSQFEGADNMQNFMQRVAQNPLSLIGILTGAKAEFERRVASGEISETEVQAEIMDVLHTVGIELPPTIQPPE